MDGLYAAVRGLARFWVWFLFKRVDVRHPERVPKAGPVLLCINHPNNLIDSVLVGAALGRKVHYLATAALFRNPLLRRFLLACGAIPVYRRQDDPEKMDRNADVFAACRRAFAEGRLIAIYPEGTTHAETRVQRIRTGAARIALGYEAEQPGTLRMIPVGLSFEARKSFNGRVLISFGEPIPVTPYLRRVRPGPGEGRRRAHHGPPVAHGSRGGARRAHRYRGRGARGGGAVPRRPRPRAARGAGTGRPPDRSLPPVPHDRGRGEPLQGEGARACRADSGSAFSAYRALLAAYRVKDEAVQARLRRPPGRRKLRQSWVAILGFPAFAYGLVVNALPFFVPRWLAHARARKETDYATIRLLASVVAFPLFWGLETWLVARLAGRWWASVFALSLPVSGLLAYQYLRGLGRLRRTLRFGVLAVTRAQDARTLVAEREAIIATLDQAKRDYLTATRGSSF